MQTMFRIKDNRRMKHFENESLLKQFQNSPILRLVKLQGSVFDKIRVKLFLGNSLVTFPKIFRKIRK